MGCDTIFPVKVMPISKDAAAIAWDRFRGSEMQYVLHNDLIVRIESLRHALETVKSDELMRVQSEIRETRRLLEVLHSHDTPAIAEVYERQQQN